MAISHEEAADAVAECRTLGVLLPPLLKLRSYMLQLRGEIALAHEALNALEEENSKLQRALGQEVSARVTADALVISHEGHIEKLERHLAEAKARVAEVESANRSLFENNRLRVSSLEGHIAELEEQLAATREGPDGQRY